MREVEVCFGAWRLSQLLRRKRSVVREFAMTCTQRVSFPDFAQTLLVLAGNCARLLFAKSAIKKASERGKETP